MTLTAEFSYRIAQSDCGSLRTLVAGAEVSLRPSGALWLDGVLVVADLHLEKGSSYARRGQMLPPYDTTDTLGRLEAEIEATSPRVVVLLGDTFHDRSSEDRLSRPDAMRLRALALGRTLVWVVGNHDADGPRDLPGEVVDELTVAGVALRHEPSPDPLAGEAAGHLHPCAKVRAASGVVRRRCFVTDGERIILPAFGAYAGGLNVRDRAFSGLFARAPLTGALGARRVHAVGWRSLASD